MVSCLTLVELMFAGEYHRSLVTLIPFFGVEQIGYVVPDTLLASFPASSSSCMHAKLL